MKSMIKFLLIVLILVPVCNVFAQDDFWKGSKQHRRERMESLRIWKMTEFLDLSTDQSAKFFPELKEFEKNIKIQQDKQKTLMMEIHEKTMESDYSPSESDVKKLARSLAEIERDIISQKEKFIISLSSILTSEQQVKYVIFEQQFRNRMMKMLHLPNNQIKGEKERRQK